MASRRPLHGGIRTSTSSEVPHVLVLTTSLLTDRMLLYSGFFDRLTAESRVSVWASSRGVGEFHDLWSVVPAQVEPFPEVGPYRLLPHTYLRRLDDFVWDYRLKPVSRLSIQRHIREKSQRASVRALKIPARLISHLGLAEPLERRVERVLLSSCRSSEAAHRLRTDMPDVVFTMGPFQYDQPAVVVEARRLGIPVVAFVPSWDNITTKNRMIFRYDGYVVWSEQTRRELRDFYPASRGAPVDIVGASQFDVFFDRRFHRSREEFCADQGLRLDRPIIVYAVGSPNLFKEHHGALDMAQRIERGELGDVQMIIRPHPIHDDDQLRTLFAPYAPRVVIQRAPRPGSHVTERSQDEQSIVEWVNTFRHADVVVNLSSTVTIDAAVCDKPVVNLDFDPEPGRPNQRLVKDVNHCWDHFRPVAESGAIWLVDSPGEMVDAICTYLARPELHSEERRKIAQYVCGHLDGRSGTRMAQAILQHVTPAPAPPRRRGPDAV